MVTILIKKLHLYTCMLVHVFNPLSFTTVSTMFLIMFNDRYFSYISSHYQN